MKKNQNEYTIGNAQASFVRPCPIIDAFLAGQDRPGSKPRGRAVWDPASKRITWKADLGRLTPDNVRRLRALITASFPLPWDHNTDPDLFKKGWILESFGVVGLSVAAASPSGSIDDPSEMVAQKVARAQDPADVIEYLEGVPEDSSTATSVLNARVFVSAWGPPSRITLSGDPDRCQFYTWAEWNDREGDPRAVFFDGFAWGYGGEGPRGLKTFLELSGFPPAIASRIAQETTTDKRPMILRVPHIAPVLDKADAVLLKDMATSGSARETGLPETLPKGTAVKVAEIEDAVGGFAFWTADGIFVGRTVGGIDGVEFRIV